MKFSVLQENLAKGLAIVGKAVATKGSLPVLANVLLATEEGRLKLAATNLETGITTWVGAKVEEEGAITIPARILAEFVGNLPPTQITGQVKNGILSIETEEARSSFNGVDAAEFPTLPIFPEESKLTFDPRSLGEAISEVAFAAASDEGRPILTGVLLKVEGQEATLVGVDGFRLSERKLALPVAVEKGFAVVIPARTLQEIVRLLSAEEEQLQVALVPNGNQVLFRGASVLISSQLLEGEFPDYQKIIPTEHSTQAQLKRSDWQKAVRLASVFAKDSASIIKLAFRPEENQVVLKAALAEVGEGQSLVAAAIEGEGLEMAFNSRYLTDILTNLADEELIFNTSGPLAPGLIKPLGRDNFLHIIMPVRVQE